MIYCTKCGTQLNEGMAFCSVCGNAVAGASANQSTANAQSQLYEEFTPLLGLGGKRWVITTNSLIYGDDEYTYDQLSPINLISAPSPLTNGSAQTSANGKMINLVYAVNQKDRFTTAITYANEQIDIAHGNTKNYKYILQSSTGSKLEVYEDYLILHLIPSGAGGITEMASNKVGSVGGGLGKGLGKLIGGIGSIGTAVGNVAKGGGATVKKIIMFDDLSVVQLLADSLVINENTIPVNQQNMGVAREIVAYIEESRNTEKENVQQQQDEREPWEPVKGTVKTFPLAGGLLDVPESMDIFNTYRLRFRDLASKYADKVEKEYNAKVRDLVTFMEFFPKIYGYHLAPLIHTATDILVAEEVWTVTYDSLMEQHIGDFHLAFDDIDVIVESMALTMEANAKSVASVMSFVPNLVGGGFGVKGAIKGIAGATAFNAVRDGIESSAMNNALNLKPAQQLELYQRIKPNVLFARVFTDYWRVFLTLVMTLNRNGRNIWWPTDESTNQAENIFQNLTNPNFPKDKVRDVFLDILKTNPYNADYQKFMVSRFGETEEVSAIKVYFGYTDFNNPRIS